jgi:hypothetical protein
MKPHLRAEIADRSASEVLAFARGVFRRAAARAVSFAGGAATLNRSATFRPSSRALAPLLAAEVGFLSVGLLSNVQVRDAAAQQREQETQEEVAPCYVVTGGINVPSGRITMGLCARAIQAESGVGTWRQYKFEVERGGRTHVNGEYVGELRWTDLPSIDAGRP